METPRSHKHPSTKGVEASVEERRLLILAELRSLGQELTSRLTEVKKRRMDDQPKS